MKRIYRTICQAIIATGVFFSTVAMGASHPMDPLSPAEIEKTVQIIRGAKDIERSALFPYIRLYEMEKSEVLKWSPGGAVHRKAEAFVFQSGKSFRAIVDLKNESVPVWSAVEDGQPPFMTREMLTIMGLVQNDSRWKEAIEKRGITEPQKVLNLPFSAGHFGDDDADRRIYRIGSYYPGDTQNYWGRQIGGLCTIVDVQSKTVLDVIDTGVVPLPTGDSEYEASTVANLRAPGNPVKFKQSGGVNFKIDGHVIEWQNWKLHARMDPQVGLVLSLVTYEDQGRDRMVLYEGAVSELYVPYMDPHPNWFSRTFIDAGEYGLGYSLSPILVGRDCPDNAVLVDAELSGVTGKGQTYEGAFAVFERYSGNPLWRHVDQITGQRESRRDQELVLRFISTVGNYDYIFDWVFRMDGTINVDVGATGICSAKSVASRTAAEDTNGVDGRYGRFVGDHTVAVNHDHFLIFRLDFDIDGEQNRFVRDALKPIRFGDDTPRTSAWQVESHSAKNEHDAKLRMNIMKPSVWRVESSTLKNAWGNPYSYAIHGHGTGISLLDDDDWPQRRAAFSEYNLWVTRYKQEERFAAGDFPGASRGKSGIDTWTAANRDILDQDIVAWYSMGFHHVVRAEDWPVMPTAWHSFSLMPFDFFDRNPAINLATAK
jgi:primary-amine oxidase